jgi:DNA-binding MarR family transcriptional regulator
MIPADLIQLFRSLKKSAIVILLMKWAGRPLGEAEVAAILDSSRTTVRAQLNSLCALGYARRERYRDGFVLTEQGQNLFDGAESKICPLPATADIPLLKLKRDSEAIAVGTGKNVPLENAPQEPVDPQIAEALRSAGIMLNARTRLLARMEHITPEYIRAHHRHLYVTRKMRSPGLLVSILESAQPLPDTGETDRHDYLSGKYAEFIEH